MAGVTALGFDEALKDYAKGEFWTNCTFNWTFNWGVVTNRGLIVGALAFLEDTSNASVVISNAMIGIGIHCHDWHSLPFQLLRAGRWKVVVTRGLFIDWQYVAEYAQAVTESLRGVYDYDHGLSESPGFNETGLRQG